MEEEKLLRAVEYLHLIAAILRTPIAVNAYIAQSILLFGASLGLLLAGISTLSSFPAGAGLICLLASVELFMTGSSKAGIRLPRFKLALAAGFLASIGFSQPVQAQEDQGVLETAEEMQDQIDKAVDSELEAARSFAERAIQLAEQQMTDAEDVGNTAVRIDEGLEDARELFGIEGYESGIMSAQDGNQSQLLILVSLDMPEEALLQLSDSALKNDAQLVIRGLVDNNFVQTQARVAEIWPEERAGGVNIDPRPFRAFEVTHVPVFLRLEAPLEPCGSLGCIPARPPFEMVRGNISLEAALDIMSDRS